MAAFDGRVSKALQHCGNQSEPGVVVRRLARQVLGRCSKAVAPGKALQRCGNQSAPGMEPMQGRRLQKRRQQGGRILGKDGGGIVADGCMQCGKTLTFNEVGAYKKFVNRGSRQFLCKACLAGKLGVTVEEMDGKIEQFKQQGCTLFA